MRLLLLFVLFSQAIFGQNKNLVPCIIDKYFCFCDSTGKVVVDEKWLHIARFEHGYARVRTATRSGYIDSTVKWESDCPFEDMGRFRYGYTWAATENKLMIINTKCEVKFEKKVRGERSAAFFDNIIIVYTSYMNYGAIDYNFKTVIPFDYCGMIQSSSDRYYFVAKPFSKKEEDGSVWGIYDVVQRKEVIPCNYQDVLKSDGSGSSSYTFSDSFLKVMENFKISLPEVDEISQRINEKYPW